MLTKKIMCALVLAIGLTACSDEFLNNSPEDALVVDNYYSSDEQLFSSTAALYGYPWFFANEKFLLCLDNLAGNSVGEYADIKQFTNMTMTDGNQFSKEGWDSFYLVIAQANMIIDIIDNKTSAGVSQEAKDAAKGEAYFMRATAYYYLVRLWGAVPVIYSQSQYIPNSKEYRIVESDIYQFIVENYKAADNLLSNKKWGSSDKGRVTSVACKAMLASVYLTLKQYADAKTMAEAVIASPDYGLLPKFEDNFHPRYNNNRESIFAIQWVATPDWGYKNTNQAYLAATSKLTATGDGWGTFVPSIDLQNAFENNDNRKHWTVMEPGDVYPELVTVEGGYTVPSTGMTNTLAGYRKYVVGSNVEWSGVGFMQTDQNTHIIRYAEVLLIHAEAILASNASTSDQAALVSFNAVRIRAGLAPKTAITMDDILQERRMELVVEGKYWFDLLRMDRAKAKAIIAAQERGEYIDRDVNNINSKKITPDDGDFVLPIPSAEKEFNPMLNEAPVALNFDYSTL